MSVFESRVVRKKRFAKKISSRGTVAPLEVLGELSQWDDSETCAKESDTASTAYTVSHRKKNKTEGMNRVVPNEMLQQETSEQRNNLYNMKSVRFFPTDTVPHTFAIGLDFFQMPIEKLSESVLRISADLGLDKAKGLNSEKLRSFVVEVLNNYDRNPYHNAVHGFSVFHMASVFLWLNPLIRHSMDKLRSLAFLLAGLSHDIGHPGTGNDIERALSTPLARTCTTSVLESLHASRTLQILDDDRYNIFDSLKATEQLAMKKFISKLIMSTDTTLGKTHITNLKSVGSLESYLNEKEDLPVVLGQKKMRLLNAIMHACDVGSQCSDMETALRWERRMATEFRHESELLSDSGKSPSKRLQIFEKGANKTDVSLFSFISELKCSEDVSFNSLALKFGKCELIEDADKEEMFRNLEIDEKVIGMIEEEKKFYSRMMSPEQANDQIWFIENKVQPLWKPIVMFSPHMRGFFLQLAQNLNLYKQLAKGNLKKAGSLFEKKAFRNMIMRDVYQKVVVKPTRRVAPRRGSM